MTKLEVLIIGMAIGWIGAIIFAVLLSESVPEPLPQIPPMCTMCYHKDSFGVIDMIRGCPHAPPEIIP
jgi:hypothetical protein